MRNIKTLILLVIIGAVLAIKGKVLPATISEDGFYEYHEYLYIAGITLFIIGILRLIVVLVLDKNEAKQENSSQSNMLKKLISELTVDKEGRIQGTTEIRWRLVIGLILATIFLALIAIVFLK